MSTNTKVPSCPVHPICWPFPTYKGQPYKPPKDHKKQRQDRMLAKAEPALL